MGKKSKEKDQFKDKSKKNKKKNGPGYRIMTLSSIRDGLLYGFLEKRSINDLKIPYFTKTGIQKNLKYNDETRICITLHQRFVLFKVDAATGEANPITSTSASKDSEDFINYELNFMDFMNDVREQVLWLSPLSGNKENKGNMPMDFYVIDSTSKAKEPQKFSIAEKAQAVATLVKVEDGKKKDFCNIWFEI